MENERRKKLLETVKKFNKDHKSEVFSLGNEIKDIETIPTGITLVDDFLGGGFKCGTHTIVWGQFSTGKTALILTTIANAQKQDKLVCYVNTEKPIEPERFKFFGINLDEMLYIEAPENAEKALEAVRTLCKEKVIDLFIIDSTNGLCPKSVQEESSGKERSLEKKNIASLPLVLSNFYNIVNAHVFRSKASVIWIGQSRTQGIGSFFVRQGLSGGMAQEFYAYQIVYMRKGAGSDAPVEKYKKYFCDKDGKVRFKTESQPCGFDCVLKLTKNNSSKTKENTEIHIPYLYKEGFVNEIKEVDDIPYEIDAKNDKEKENINKFLIDKGVIKLKESEKEPLTEEQNNDILNIDDKKKKRGRPKKK